MGKRINIRMSEKEYASTSKLADRLFEGNISKLVKMAIRYFAGEFISMGDFVEKEKKKKLQD